MAAGQTQDLLERGQRDQRRGEREAAIGAENVGPERPEPGNVELVDLSPGAGHARQVGVVEHHRDAVGSEAHVELADDTLL